MNWISLHQKYPTAYEYMEENFNCLFTEHYSCLPDGLVKGITIKHPLKRDLYDFFDKLGIKIYLEYGRGGVGGDKFNTQVRFEGSNWYMKATKDRSVSETEAFTKAFEVLDNRLKEIND